MFLNYMRIDFHGYSPKKGNRFLLLAVAHNIIKQCAFVHVGPEIITMGDAPT